MGEETQEEERALETSVNGGKSESLGVTQPERWWSSLLCPCVCEKKTRCFM